MAIELERAMEGADIPAPGGGSSQPLYFLLNTLKLIGGRQGHPLDRHRVLTSLGTSSTRPGSTGERGGTDLLAGGARRAGPDAAGQLEVRVRGEVEGGAGWRGGGGRRGALGAGEEVVLVVVGGAGVGVQEGRGGGGVGEEREDGEVLAERGDGVADGGGVAAARAREDGARRGGEHAREAGAAEAVAAVEEQRRALVLVVADVAERAARHPHRAAPRPGGGWGFGAAPVP